MKKIAKVMNMPRLPLRGSIDLTYRCNNHCRHCWLWVPDQDAVRKEELNIEEIRRIVDEARAMGCRYWYISGGEPLLRPDFPEIFEYLTNKAIGYTLNTNGTLITPEIARLLTRKGTKMVALYGADAEVYDHVTRHPGGFEKLIQGMNYLKEAGAGFLVQLIPMKANYHQWEKMVGLAKSFSSHWRMGAPWLYLSADGSPDRNKEIAAQRLEPCQMIELAKPIPSFGERMAEVNAGIGQAADHGGLESFNSNPISVYSCGAADHSDDCLFARCIEKRREFHIDAYGRMTWCSYIKDPALRFDLRQGSFEEAWDKFIPSCSEKVFGGREWRENCGSCSKSKNCRWCAVYAYLETGRYSATIPYLCAVAKEAERFKQQWKKKHRRYFQIAGITVQLDSEIDFDTITFNNRLKSFAAESFGHDNIFLRHYFELPDLEEKDFGRKIYQKKLFGLFNKNGTWFYKRYISNENKNEKMYQLAVFSADHRNGTFYSPPYIREEILENGWPTLSLFPSDQFWLLPILADRQALLLHSAAAIIRGKGFIFVGGSEAGKSTTVELLKAAGCKKDLEIEILCDEHNIVRHWHNGWRVHGTWRHSTVSDVSTADAPLCGIFFLQKATENEIVPLSDLKLIWRHLLAALIRVVDTDELWKKKLDIMEEIVQTVSCYIMRFDKSGKIISELERLAR